MTIFVAKSGAHSYLDESMLVVAAAGIAARSTASLGARPETIPHLKRTNRMIPRTPGIMISRSMVYRMTVLSTSSDRLISERIIPITIMESAVLQRPTVCSISKSQSGMSAMPANRSVSIIKIPIRQATTQGWVMTLRRVSLRLDWPLKIAIPLDHMMILTGIR